jgi:hypothetical protein
MDGQHIVQSNNYIACFDLVVSEEEYNAKGAQSNIARYDTAIPRFA